MPNQRKRSKRGISVYVPDDIKEALKAEAERNGEKMSRLVTRIYREALAQRGYVLKPEEE